LQLGIGVGAIDLRVRRARLHLLHRGVYAVGHRVVTIQGHRIAAVLSVGPDADLSYRDAAAEWSILQYSAGPVHVTAPRKLHRRPGLLLHCCRLPHDERTVRDGIPITSVARTILDLAGHEPRRRVEAGLHESEVLRLTDPLGLPRLLERYPRARGTATLRAILADRGAGHAATKDEIVQLLVALCDDHGLPRPLLNHWITKDGRSYECDCVWPLYRLIVELDGHATHSTRKKFESDRARDRALAPEWLVIRVTWRQLTREPEAVAADLRRLLARPLAA
jgi:hypothetical protein